MREPKLNKSFIETWTIRNKETGEYFVARSGKNAWRNKAAAKNAWANTYRNYFYYDDEEVKEMCDKANTQPVLGKMSHNMTFTFPYFDEQDQWVLVELNGKVEDTGKRIKQAEHLLQECVNQKSLSEDLEQQVEDFLNE